MLGVRENSLSEGLCADIGMQHGEKDKKEGSGSAAQEESEV